MPSYTTSWENVSDGYSKVYNTDTLTGDDTTNIHNAEVQWEGVTTSETTEETDTFVNTTTDTWFNDGDSVTAQYPDIPNNYSWDNHGLYINITNSSDSDRTGDVDWDNVYETGTESNVTVGANTTVYLNVSPIFETTDEIGSTTSATGYFGFNTLDVELDAQTTGTKTVTNTYYTEDPSVSGDVSASGPTQLNDGEQSTWYALSGLDAGVDETFNFSINGSNEARFRFRFDYDPPTASPTYGTYSVQYGGTWYEIAIADSTDSQLQTDEVQIYSNGSWGVLDLVPASYSDDYTVDFIRFYNGTEWLKARVYNTRSV